LAISSGLFAEDEAEVVRTLMDDFFARTKADGHGCLVDVDDDLDGDVAAGVAYFQPVAATDGTWTLLMIAVRPEQQGQGRGSVLLSEVENQLRRQQQRLLLVETSGVPDFALTGPSTTRPIRRGSARPGLLRGGRRHGAVSEGSCRAVRDLILLGGRAALTLVLLGTA
jgi:GNAT superfamily N-acetyltransferase